MQFGRLQCLVLTAALVGALGMSAAQAAPLAVVANFTDPGAAGGPPWPPGTVTIIDTATDRPVGTPLTVGVNPMAVTISPDGKTAVIACSQSGDIWWIDLSANPPAVTGNLSLGSGSGDTFYPASLAMSPDGQYVVVSSDTGSSSNPSTQTHFLKVVSMKDHSVQTFDLQAVAGSTLTAEATAISPMGAIIGVSPSAQPAQIWALPFADGGINFPDQPEAQQVGQTGHPGYNVALSADGSMGIIPLWLGKFDVVSIDATRQLTIAQPLVPAGGNGTHSVAISADGTTAYIRNLLPPANIAVFKIAKGPMVTDTGLRLNADGLPASVVQLAQIQGNGFGFVGSEMIAVTPDNKKIYAVNPFAGPPDPNFLGLYGYGELQVFSTSSPNAIATVPTGKNPIAVAIQPH